MERRLRLERFKAGSTVSRRGSLWPHTTWPSTPKRYTQPVRHRASRPRTHGAVRLTDWYQYGTSCPAASRPAARARVSPVRASPSPRRSHDSIDTFRYLPRTEPSTESRAAVSSQQRNFRIYPVKLPASPPTRNRETERERGTCAISSVETLRQVCAQLSKLVRDRIPFGLTECPGVRFVRHFISALASWTWIHGGTGSRVAASHRKSLLPRCSALGPVSPQLFLLHVSPNFIAFIATDYGNARIQVCH